MSNENNNEMKNKTSVKLYCDETLGRTFSSENNNGSEEKSNIMYPMYVAGLFLKYQMNENNYKSITIRFYVIMNII